MRIVFLGEDLTQGSILEYLEGSDHEIVARIPNDTAIDVNAPESIQKIAALKPDIAFSVYFSQILKREFLDLFPKGCINFHPSLLPKYRGNTPIRSAIINGEQFHGVTFHYMNETIDSGDIVAQEPFQIHKKDTGLDVEIKCEKAGLRLFKRIVARIERGVLQRIPQNPAEATVSKKLSYENAEVDLSWDKERIYNFVRAFTYPPMPPAFMKVNDEKIYLTTKIQTYHYRERTKNASKADQQYYVENVA